MSSNNTHAVRTYTDAVAALVKAARSFDRAGDRRDAAFIASAVAASQAIASGVTLAALARETVAYCEANGIDTDAAPRDSLYVSKAALAVHALAGDVLSLPESDDDQAAKLPAPLAIQSLVRRVYKGDGLGASVVRRVVRKAATRQAAVADLKAALAGAQAAREESTDTETRMTSPATLADMLRGIVAAIDAGANVDAAAVAALAEVNGAVTRATATVKAA